MRYNTENKSVHHIEGGWPKDVNIQEQDQVNRYRKKIEKDELYLHSLQRLIQVQLDKKCSFISISKKNPFIFL